jgi:hypothetical protein
MKKNLNKIPDIFKVKIDGSENNLFIAATTIEATKTEITSGKYSYLGLVMSDAGRLIINPEIYPDSKRGRYCKRNRDGWSITRKDLPKISKTFYMGERPIFGDYSKGTFSMSVTRMVFQKDFIAPPEITLSITLLRSYPRDTDEVFVLKVVVNDVVDKSQDNFESRILFNINLLQENLFKSDVFESNASEAEFLKTVIIGWELLPLGNRELIETLIASGGGLSDLQQGTIRERYNFLESLNPMEWIKGVSGMRRYFGAKFAENLVVLENMDYGNAIYVMFGNWEELSKLSRTDLLKKSNRDFERIKHNGSGWRTKLQMIINDKLTNN